jgi:serine/threonine protein kinase
MSEWDLATPKIRGLERLVKIGDGGFGTVYRAWEPEFHRTVAVKVLHARGRKRQALMRFKDECAALGRVGSHRNVVTVHRAGILRDRRPYIVMEYLRPGSFAERRTNEGPLGWEEVTSIGVKLAGALQSAHNAGILHRDINLTMCSLTMTESQSLPTSGLRNWVPSSREGVTHRPARSGMPRQRCFLVIRRRRRPMSTAWVQPSLIC